MATRKVSLSILECDGCAKRHGVDQHHRSAAEARAAAYLDGWRFPAIIAPNGNPGSASNDVCPECLPGWQPRYRENRQSSRTLRVGEAL